MTAPDLNLLATLDALLAEGSVTGAARRLRLSASAMSRALARVRRATGDPLLVRAGRGLVPTPRALELRERVGRLVEEAGAVLRPAEKPDLATLRRTFTLRTADGFVESFGPALVARAGRDAPEVTLSFVQKTEEDGEALRDGRVDLETGVVREATSPELRVQMLFRDRFVGVVRRHHPLSRGAMTARRFASGRHVAVARRGSERGPVDDGLGGLGLERAIVAVVGGFAAALALARGSDLVASVPERHTDGLRGGLHAFRLPFATPELVVSMLWHPRMHADPAHAWLRGCVLDICGARRAKTRDHPRRA